MDQIHPSAKVRVAEDHLSLLGDGSVYSWDVDEVLDFERAGSVLGFDRDVGHDSTEPRGHGPVGRSNDVHDGWYEQASDDQCVHQDREPEAESKLLQAPLSTEQERSEHENHDGSGCSNDPPALRLTSHDGHVVAPRC